MDNNQDRKQALLLRLRSELIAAGRQLRSYDVISPIEKMSLADIAVRVFHGRDHEYAVWLETSQQVLWNRRPIDLLMKNPNDDYVRNSLAELLTPAKA
jgi:hypothetical protein